MTKRAGIFRSAAFSPQIPTAPQAQLQYNKKINKTKRTTEIYHGKESTKVLKSTGTTLAAIINGK
jgi:hypothetical protein